MVAEQLKAKLFVSGASHEAHPVLRGGDMKGALMELALLLTAIVITAFPSVTVACLSGLLMGLMVLLLQAERHKLEWLRNFGEEYKP